MQCYIIISDGSGSLNEFLRWVFHRILGFMDKDPIPLITSTDMAILDAAKALGFCFVTLLVHN